MTPSKAITNIVKGPEKIFKIYVTPENPKNIYNIIVLKSIQNCYISEFFCDPENLQNRDGIDTHMYILIKFVINIYLKIRMFHFMKQINMKKIGVRNKLIKLIHFKEGE